jgi:carboxyl-terminal processing protease
MSKTLATNSRHTPHGSLAFIQSLLWVSTFIFFATTASANNLKSSAEIQAESSDYPALKNNLQPAEDILSAPLLSPLDIHPRTSLNVLEQLRRNHYVDKIVDDELSEQVFDKYLTVLDPGRYYFVREDIKEFEQYRRGLDDALKMGNLKPAFTIFNRYQQRVVERLNYLIGLIDNGLDTLDFTKDESIVIDRKASSWSENVEAQNDLWRRRLKAQVLSMRLNDKPLEDVAEQLRKRYRNQLKIAVRNKSEDAFQAYINAFAHTYDPHTEYFSPRTSENFNINMSLSLEGIGAVLKSEDDAVEVVRLVPAGPADKSGALKPADKITAVGQGAEGPLIDVVGWRLDDVVALIRGPKGSTVRLSVVLADDKETVTKNITIVRNKIKLEEQAAKAKTITLGEDEDRLIGVIEIPTFYADFAAQQKGDPNYRSTTRDVRRLVKALKEKGVEGLIVDLRSNGGGSLQEADTMTGLFIKSGPTVQVKSARRRANVLQDNNLELAWDGPMAVMVNRLSASASEIFAGAMQDYGRALILGNQTFGKGTVQTLIPLNRGQLKLTAAKFYRISGQSTQHQGVIPDIAFPELVDSSVIGESTLEGAMPWDKITPAKYRPINSFSPFIPSLKTKHALRAANDPYFQYYRSLSERSEERSERKLLSLNETTRRAERAKDDIWRLDTENELRIAIGKPEAETLEDLKDLQEEEAKMAKSALTEASTEESAGATSSSEQTENNRLSKDVIEEIDEDPLLREAGRVLTDFVDKQSEDEATATLAIDNQNNSSRFDSWALLRQLKN